MPGTVVSYQPPNLVSMSTCKLLVDPGSLKLSTFERLGRSCKTIKLMTESGKLEAQVSGISYAYDGDGFIAMLVVNTDDYEDYYELDADPDCIPQLTFCGRFKASGRACRGYRRVGWHVGE